jgi:hypothetical protein
VLFPLALPNIFNSLRLLFGLAFGYIMLVELVKVGDAVGGLGNLISTSERRGPREHILLILMIIPLVALGIDRLIYWVQMQLFPHIYGGSGLLRRLARGVIHLAEDLLSLVFRKRSYSAAVAQAHSPSNS